MKNIRVRTKGTNTCADKKLADAVKGLTDKITETEKNLRKDFADAIAAAKLDLMDEMEKVDAKV